MCADQWECSCGYWEIWSLCYRISGSSRCIQKDFGQDCTIQIKGKTSVLREIWDVQSVPFQILIAASSEPLLQFCPKECTSQYPAMPLTQRLRVPRESRISCDVRHRTTTQIVVAQVSRHTVVFGLLGHTQPR